MEECQCQDLGLHQLWEHPLLSFFSLVKPCPQAAHSWTWLPLICPSTSLSRHWLSLKRFAPLNLKFDCIKTLLFKQGLPWQHTSWLFAIYLSLIYNIRGVYSGDLHLHPLPSSFSSVLCNQTSTSQTSNTENCILSWLVFGLHDHSGYLVRLGHGVEHRVRGQKLRACLKASAALS